MALELYGRVSFLDKLKILFTLFRLRKNYHSILYNSQLDTPPPVAVSLTIRLVLSPFRAHDQHRSWSRVASDESFRFISSRLRVNQMQYIMGTTSAVYTTWAKKNGKPVIIDDLGHGGSLMWFTDRQTSGKIVFYLHGKLGICGYLPSH